MKFGAGVLVPLVALLLLSCSAKSEAPGSPGDRDRDDSPTSESTPGQSNTGTPGASRTPSTAPTSTPGTASGPANHDGARTLEHIRQLSVVIGERVSGTDGELEAVDYISEQFRSYGYVVEVQEFEFQDRGFIPETLVVGQDNIASRRLTGGGDGSVTAAAVFAGIGNDADFQGKNVRGKIAIVDRGSLTFDQKVANARQAGAISVIVINTEPGLFNGRVTNADDIIVMGVGSEDGARLRDAGAKGETLTLTVPKSIGRNVIARPSSSATCSVVVGGHHDSVSGVPGASDNASGTGATIELARAFAVDGIDAGLCFVTFGAEESGLYGSAAFVEQELDAGRDPRAMINLDVLGTGTRAELIGDERLTGEAAAIAERLGIDARPTVDPAGTSSDHASFLKAGIPALFIASNDYSKIHTAADSIEIIHPKLLDQEGDLAYEVIAAQLKQVARR